MRRIDPADLGVFIAIARHGSFRRAATELGLTPSAISHALRTLEERIDVRLFNRTTRSVALTEAGARLFERVQPAFRDIDDALDDLTAERGTPVGRLRINTAESAARLVLMPMIGDFLRAHPGINLELVTQGALVDIVAEGFDAGLRFGERVAADMIAVPIGPRQRFAAYASPDFLDRHPRPHHPRELTALPCIRYLFDNLGTYDWEFERGGIEVTVKVDGPFATNSAELMVRGALDGLGIAFTFEGLVEQHFRDGRLVRVLEDWNPYWPGLHLYYPSRRHMPSALRAFIDFARARTAQAG